MRNSLPPRALALAVCLALATGCGKDAPNAPVTPPPAFGTDVIAGQVVLTLAPGADPAALASDFGATVLDWDADERTVTLAPPSNTTTAIFLAMVRGDSRVVTCEENGAFEPAESRQQSFAFDDGAGTPQNYAEQSAGRAIGLAAAHGVSTGSGVIVAVLDTGIDPAHPAFTGRLLAGHDFVSDDTDPTDVTNGLDDDSDGHVDEAWGHGTHVAGIVALVAPDAQLLPVRVLDADGRGDVQKVAAGVRWAVAHGATVINLSLGSLKSSDAIQNALEAAESQGVAVFASVGNWGAEQPQEYPARSSKAYAIAACDTAAHPAAFTSFAGYVALSAPGVALRSAYPGGGYRLWSGSSMSTPLVAGAAALLRAAHPAWTTRDIVDQLAATATPIVGASDAQRNRLGAGMLNAAAALTSPNAVRTR